MDVTKMVEQAFHAGRIEGLKQGYIEGLAKGGEAGFAASSVDLKSTSFGKDFFKMKKKEEAKKEAAKKKTKKEAEKMKKLQKKKKEAKKVEEKKTADSNLFLKVSSDPKKNPIETPIDILVEVCNIDRTSISDEIDCTPEAGSAKIDCTPEAGPAIDCTPEAGPAIDCFPEAGSAIDCTPDNRGKRKKVKGFNIYAPNNSNSFWGGLNGPVWNESLPETRKRPNPGIYLDSNNEEENPILSEALEEVTISSAAACAITDAEQFYNTFIKGQH